MSARAAGFGVLALAALALLAFVPCLGNAYYLALAISLLQYTVLATAWGMNRIVASNRIALRALKVNRMIAGAFDCTAFGMSEHNHQFGSNNLAGIFHAADDIIVYNIACYANTENIAETLVEDVLD